MCYVRTYVHYINLYVWCFTFLRSVSDDLVERLDPCVFLSTDCIHIQS